MVSRQECFPRLKDHPAAHVSPPTAMLPVTYTWRVSESANQRIITHTGGLSDTAVFTWNVAGTQVVTVMAVNECGVAVSKPHTITVEAVPCVGLDEVGISGPTEGHTDTLDAFTGVITPSDATAPITYTWSPQPDSGQETASAEYQWATSGLYTITLEAENCGGPVSATHTITVEAQKWHIYLPLALSSVEGLAVKNYAPTAAGLLALNGTAVVTETVIRYDYDFTGNNLAGGIPR